MRFLQMHKNILTLAGYKQQKQQQCRQRQKAHQLSQVYPWKSTDLKSQLELK